MIVTILFVDGLVLAAIEEIRARGNSLLAWAVIAIAVGLLWPHLN